jgi:hypothetical protein
LKLHPDPLSSLYCFSAAFPDTRFPTPFPFGMLLLLVAYTHESSDELPSIVLV